MEPGGCGCTVYDARRGRDGAVAVDDCVDCGGRFIVLLCAFCVVFLRWFAVLLLLTC